MASEELVNRLRERATTLRQWAGRAERTTGPSATTEQWRIDRDLHDDAATEIYRLARELEATRAALRIAQTTAANLHDTIRLRDRELEEARARLEQYQRLVVFADSTARARGDACGLCDALGRDDQPYQSHRAADLIAEAERALIARRGEGGGE